MEDATRRMLLRRLGDAMSDISEDCYYAGWMVGTEYLVPELCRRAVRSGRPSSWGHGEVTPDRARELVTPAEQVGSWADLDEEGVGFVAFDPFPIPAEHVEAVEREQSRRDAASRRRGPD